MKLHSQKAARQSKEVQKSESANSETDSEDSVRTSTLKLEHELWPDDDPLSSDEMEKEKK